MPAISAEEPVSQPSGEALLAEVTAVLNGAAVPAPAQDARALIARYVGVASAETGVAVRDLPGLWQAVERRAAREPVEYITGVAGFRSLRLEVGPGVFVPRRESEVVVEVALDELRGSAAPTVVDLGTGSGAIALALALEVPAAVVYGVEVSPAAFAWTRRNFATLAPRNSRPLLGDLVDALPELDGLVDVVVANPPYIPVGAVPRDPEVRLHSPDVALFGGADGLDLVRGISRVGRRLLRTGGLLVVEHGELQAGPVADLLRADGWADIAVHHDHLDRDRATAARLRQDEAMSACGKSSQA